ncbi:type IV secretory system conjugative DNA transfer family protein (plasmid) [Deinococcus sp. AJ005]|nr:type IV secretory system conjugative DNA transfer family protein [Deinococcus sp. AJ005]
MPFLFITGVFRMQPGPTLFVTIAGVSLILFYFSSMVPTGAYSGRFMRHKEAEKFLITREEEPYMLPVAALDGQPIGIKPYVLSKIQGELGHLTVIAPTRSGKGLLLTSHLLTWVESAIVLDIKGENWEKTSAARAELGPVYVLNPEGMGSRFDPIAELMELGTDSEAALLQAVNVILKPEEDTQPIFLLTAVPALRAGMRVAHALGEPVLPWVYAQSRAGMRAYVRNVQAQAERLGDWASIDDMTQYLGRPVAEVQDAQWADSKWMPAQAWANLTAALGRVCTEGVLKMTSGRDFSAADLKRRPTSVYLIWKEDMGEGLKDAFSLVSLALLKGLSRYADNHKGEVMTEVLFVVDEAGTFKVPDLPKLMATLAGRGVWLSPYFQNVVQMQRQYGENAEQEIINNSSAVVWYPSAEKSAGEYIEQFAGKESVVTTSASSEGTTTASTTDRPIITASEFSQLGENAVLVQFKNHQWLKAEPMRWFEFAHLKDRVQEKGVGGGPIAWSLSDYRSRIAPIRPVAQAQPQVRAITPAPAVRPAPPLPPPNAPAGWYNMDDEDEKSGQKLN